MKFSIISDAFQKMETTRKRLELTDILVELIKEIPIDVISKATYLIQGKLRPNFEGIELGIAEKLVMKAMSKSSGIPLKQIENDYNKCGDLGQTAENILQKKNSNNFWIRDNHIRESVPDIIQNCKSRWKRFTRDENEIRFKFIE